MIFRIPNTTTLLQKETTRNGMDMTECATLQMATHSDQTVQTLKAHGIDPTLNTIIAMYIKIERTTDSEINTLPTVLIDLQRTREGGKQIIELIMKERVQR